MRSDAGPTTRPDLERRRAPPVSGFILALILGASPGSLAGAAVDAPRSAPKASASGTRTVVVAGGVHLFLHADATEDWPQGNTIVIEGDRGLFVVDSAYLPLTARDDLRLIRSLSDKPVRYLLNTHWHHDHNLGNGVYAEAWPAAG